MERHSLRCRFASVGYGGPTELLKAMYKEVDFDTYTYFMLNLYNTGEIDLKYLYGRVSYTTFMLAYNLVGKYVVFPVTLE